MFLRTFVSVFLLQLFISLIFDAADNGVRVENSDFLATFGGDVDFQVVGFSNEHLESEVDPSLHVLENNHKVQSLPSVLRRRKRRRTASSAAASPPSRKIISRTISFSSYPACALHGLETETQKLFYDSSGIVAGVGPLRSCENQLKLFSTIAFRSADLLASSWASPAWEYVGHWSVSGRGNSARGFFVAFFTDTF